MGGGGSVKGKESHPIQLALACLANATTPIDFNIKPSPNLAGHPGLSVEHFFWIFLKWPSIRILAFDLPLYKKSSMGSLLFGATFRGFIVGLPLRHGRIPGPDRLHWGRALVQFASNRTVPLGLRARSFAPIAAAWDSEPSQHTGIPEDFDRSPLPRFSPL